MLRSAFLAGSNPVHSTNIESVMMLCQSADMILRHGITASYIVLDGWERRKQRDQIRDWCLENGLVIDASDGSSNGKVNECDQTIVRFASREDATLCYLTVK